MCDPRPGARCSADTANELQTAQERYAAAQADSTQHPEDVEARRRLSLASAKLAQKQDAYDSAPRGQAELRAAIAANPNAESSDLLRTRLATGRITRVDQKRALARSRGGSSADEQGEAEKALRRLRHPAHLDELGDSPALGFFVTTRGVTTRHLTAESARAAARAKGAGVFYDAQTGEHVPAQESR